MNFLAGSGLWDCTPTFLYRLTPLNQQTAQTPVQHAPVSKLAWWTTKGILDHKHSTVIHGQSLGRSPGHHFLRIYCASWLWNSLAEPPKTWASGAKTHLLHVYRHWPAPPTIPSPAAVWAPRAGCPLTWSSGACWSLQQRRKPNPMHIVYFRGRNPAVQGISILRHKFVYSQQNPKGDSCRANCQSPKISFIAS